MSESSGVLPGAIEPLPANPVIEEEFWARVDERKARGRVASRSSAEVAISPPLEGGWVGWCVTVRGSAHDGSHCPIAPQQEEIAYEQWEAAAGGTQGYVLAPAAVSAVAIDEEAVAPLVPVAGFSGVLGAAVVDIPDPFPWSWTDEFEPVINGLRSNGLRGLTASPSARSISLAASYWRAPQSPPPGACEIAAARGLRGAKPLWGHTVAGVPAEPGIAGGGFTSCADTELAYQYSSLDAAVLLDAASPGATPQPLPNEHAIHGRPGLSGAPGWSGAILARRIPGAWLVVEGGRGLAQRERVLAHLTAVVHL